jgi:hypothetical protein
VVGRTCACACWLLVGDAVLASLVGHPLWEARPRVRVSERLVASFLADQKSLTSSHHHDPFVYSTVVVHEFYSLTDERLAGNWRHHRVNGGERFMSAIYPLSMCDEVSDCRSVNGRELCGAIYPLSMCDEFIMTPPLSIQ